MSLLASFIPIATDSEGRTIPNALLYSYDVGTNTPKDTYSDSGLSIPNANPLESDGAGRFFNVYLGAGGYKLVLRDSNDVVLWTQDNYYQALDGADLANIDADIDALAANTAENICVYTDSGAADAYVLAPTGFPTAPVAYTSGMMIVFKPTNANTGASTVNVSTLGNKNLLDQSGNALTSGFIETGKYYCFVYESGAFRYMWRSGLVNPANMTTGTANNLLAYNSSGAVSSVINPMRLLTSGSIAANPDFSFVLSSLQSTQASTNAYLIKLVGFQPASDDVNLYITLSSDGGATYESTAYDSVSFGYDVALAAARTQGVDDGAQIQVGSSAATFSLGNAAGETATLEMRCYLVNTGASVIPHLVGEISYYNSLGDLTRMSFSGSRTTAADYDAIKFAWEGGGNFAAVGSYYVYAIPNAI